MKNIKTLSKKLILDNGKFLKVEIHEVEFPNGTVINDWSWVISPDFISVTAITSEGKFLLLKQQKYAFEGFSIAPVGGYIEPNEDPLAAAKRELFEETGFEASEWISFGSFYADSNKGCGKGHLFLAKNAVKTGEPTEIDMEEPEIVFLNENEVKDVLKNGDVKVLPWAACLLFAINSM
jgi:ADP-ribose pyrophosphatase